MVVTLTDSTASLLDWYLSADEATLDRGRRWYDAARTECRRIARGSRLTYRQVAAIMAVTSSDAQLSTNIRWTREAVASMGAAKVGRYPVDMGRKVRAIVADRRDPGQYVKGPKVSAFYAAIVGDDDCLVIDRWAMGAAGHGRDLKKLTAALRRDVAAAYRSAAALMGETVRDFQAIVWIACRENTVRADGRLVRLADITA